MPPSQVRHSDQGDLAFLEGGGAPRSPAPPQLCQHGPGPVPAGQSQSLYQGSRVGRKGTDQEVLAQPVGVFSSAPDTALPLTALTTSQNSSGMMLVVSVVVPVGGNEGEEV